MRPRKWSIFYRMLASWRNIGSTFATSREKKVPPGAGGNCYQMHRGKVNEHASKGGRACVSLPVVVASKPAFSLECT